MLLNHHLVERNAQRQWIGLCWLRVLWNVYTVTTGLAPCKARNLVVTLRRRTVPWGWWISTDRPWTFLHIDVLCVQVLSSVDYNPHSSLTASHLNPRVAWFFRSPRRLLVKKEMGLTVSVCAFMLAKLPCVLRYSSGLVCHDLLSAQESRTCFRLHMKLNVL
jgi:hypothetical protein